MSASVEYKGHSIRWSDNADEWTCFDIGKSNKSLAAIKSAIDRIYLKIRKGAAFECYQLEVSLWGEKPPKIKPAQVIDYLKPIRKKRPNKFERAGTGEIEDHEVAIMSKSQFSDKRARSRVSLSKLLLPGPTLDEDLSELVRLHQLATAAKQAMDAHEKEMRARNSVTLDHIADLKAASEHVISEGEV